MKFAKQAVVAVALLSSIGSTWAWWGSNSYQGEVTSDRGTRLPVDSQDRKTWDDWVWRGKQDGTVQSCDRNGGKCTFSWNTTKGTSYSHTKGWAVGGGFGFEKKVFNGSVTAEYQRQKTWTQSQSETFNLTQELSPGQWAQPVIVAVRRWKKGHFYGGHFADQISRSNKWNYTYDWAWRNYGSWQGNEKEWGFKKVHIVNNRNDL